MSNVVLSAFPASAQSKPLSDGRRERSRSSRDKIVQAMLELVERGDVTPGAARVADHAGVGLRTVFRHFDDMDSLYREITERIEAQVMPIALQPYASEDWRDRLDELVTRRGTVFEAIMPFRLSANIKRYQSAYLMQDYVRLNRLERQLVEAILPADILNDRLTLESLHVALSFQSWRSMRHDHGLPPDQATAVTRHLVHQVMAGRQN